MKVANKTTPVGSVAPEREEDADILQAGEEREYRVEGLNRKIVGVQRGPGGHPQCIAQYGPYESAKYRVQSSSKDTLTDVSNPIGEMKIIRDNKSILLSDVPTTVPNMGQNRFRSRY